MYNVLFVVGCWKS